MEEFYHGDTENTEVEEWKDGRLERWKIGRMEPRKLSK